MREQTPHEYARHILNRAHALAETAARHSRQHSPPPGTLLSARLAPDMLSLERQFQILIDGIHGGMTRMAGHQPPQPEDPAYAVFNRGDDSDFTEPAEDFDTIGQRIQTCMKQINQLPSFTIEQLAERTIDVQWKGTIRRFNGQQFLLYYVIPNAFFHLSMAYAILRQQGLPLGKQDFEGPACYKTIHSL